MKAQIINSKKIVLESETELEAKKLMSLLSGAKLRFDLGSEEVSEVPTEPTTQKKKKRKTYSVGRYRKCPVSGCGARVKGANGIGIHLRKAHGICQDGTLHNTFSHRGKEFPVPSPVVSTKEESNHPQLPIGFKVVALGERMLTRTQTDTPETVAEKSKQAGGVLRKAKQYLNA